MNRNVINDIEDIEEVNTKIFLDINEFSENIRNYRQFEYNSF